MAKFRRNPLKSGQCFLLKHDKVNVEYLKKALSQSPQIGSMFLTQDVLCRMLDKYYKLKSQSPQIGSMFLTGEKEGSLVS